MELIKVDADKPENEDLLRKYDIRSIPTLILLDSDSNVLSVKVGEMSQNQLTQWLETYLEQ